MKDYPTAWKRYRDLVKAGVLLEDGNVNRFAARYRMASKLESVHFSGFSDATSAGYTEGLRVALAYSALESLEAVASSDRRRPEKVLTVVSPALSSAFRSTQCARLREQLDQRLDGKDLPRRLRDLTQDLNVEDVRPVAEGLRNLVVHGLFTPEGSGFSRSVAIRTFIAALAREVTASTDRHFSSWLAPVLKAPHSGGDVLWLDGDQ